MPKKKIFLAILLLIIIGVGGFFLKKYSQDQVGITSDQQAMRFTGSPNLVQGDILYIDGYYLTGDSRVIGSQEDGYTLAVKVDSSTVITKTDVTTPSEAALKASNGKFNLEDLPKQDGPGTLEDLRQQMGNGSIRVTADFSKEINHAKQPTATKIYYWVLHTNNVNQNE